MAVDPFEATLCLWAEQRVRESDPGEDFSERLPLSLRMLPIVLGIGQQFADRYPPEFFNSVFYLHPPRLLFTPPRLISRSRSYGYACVPGRATVEDYHSPTPQVFRMR